MIDINNMLELAYRFDHEFSTGMLTNEIKENIDMENIK